MCVDAVRNNMPTPDTILNSAAETSAVEDTANTECDEADNVGELLYSQLQESLLECNSLKQEVKSLQEKLSVCRAKENQSEGKFIAYKQQIANLTESNKKLSMSTKDTEELTENLKKYEEQLANSDSKIDELNYQLSTMDKFKSTLSETYNNNLSAKSSNVFTLFSLYSPTSTRTTILDLEYLFAYLKSKNFIKNLSKISSC